MANPLYRQIAEDLREQIESGGLHPGQQLRTELELQEHYRASRNTVRDAIKWLTTLGLVETRPGQGTFVVKKMDPYITTLTAPPARGLRHDDVVASIEENTTGYESEVKRQKRKPSYSDLVVRAEKASGEVAAQLQVPESTPLISRHQSRYIDGTPWSLQTSYYPREFFAQGAERLMDADDIPEGAVRYLADTLGLRQIGYRDWITVRSPDTAEAAFFNLSADGRTGLFEIFRIGFDQTRKPMRLTVTVFPTDRNQFVVNVGDVPPLASGEEGADKERQHARQASAGS
jgi:GntR family transcriptional regulator